MMETTKRYESESHNIEKIFVAPTRAPRRQYGFLRRCDFHPIYLSARARYYRLDRDRRRRLLDSRGRNGLAIHGHMIIATRFFHGCLYRNSRFAPTPPAFGRSRSKTAQGRPPSSFVSVPPCWVRNSVPN